MKIELNEYYINKHGHEIKVVSVNDTFVWFEYTTGGQNFTGVGVALREWKLKILESI